LTAAPSAAELAPRLKRLVVESLKLDGLDPDSIGDDQPLFGGALGLDSVDALELVVALEREFGVTVPSEEVGSDAFGSVRALAEWLAPQLASDAAAGPAPDSGNPPR
jgi:acyl carrier protein